MNEKEPHFLVQINDLEPVKLTDFVNSPLLPEKIHALKIDFDTASDNSLDLIGLIMLLETLLSKVKNNTEYTVLLDSLVNNMIIIKKLENEAQLGEYTY